MLDCADPGRLSVGDAVACVEPDREVVGDAVVTANVGAGAVDTGPGRPVGAAVPEGAAAFPELGRVDEVWTPATDVLVLVGTGDGDDCEVKAT